MSGRTSRPGRPSPSGAGSRPIRPVSNCLASPCALPADHQRHQELARRRIDGHRLTVGVPAYTNESDMACKGRSQASAECVERPSAAPTGCRAPRRSLAVRGSGAGPSASAVAASRLVRRHDVMTMSQAKAILPRDRCPVRHTHQASARFAMRSCRCGAGQAGCGTPGWGLPGRVGEARSGRSPCRRSEHFPQEE